MRRIFADELYRRMQTDKDIWLISIDLGYKLWDQIAKDFPERFMNTGASEQAAMGIAVGLALEGKKPFIYSATTFLLYRPFETIRNYINHEKIAVRLVGSGRDKDYLHDGWSHWSDDARTFLATCLENIETLWPDDKEEIPELVEAMVRTDKPWFISLRR